MWLSLSLKKLAQHYRMYLLPSLTALLILVLTITFIQPKISDIFKMQQDLSQGQTRLSRLTQKANILTSLDSGELRTRFKTVEGALPSEKDIPGFLVEMQRIANEASASVDMIELSAGSISTPSATTTTPAVSTSLAGTNIITAKVTVKGTFSALRQFLDKVAQARRLVSIKGISLSGTEAQKASGPISLELNFSIYYQPLPTTLGEISNALPQLSADEEKMYQKVAAYRLYSSFEGAGTATVPVGKTDLFH